MINASGRDIRLQVDGGVTAANIKEIAEVTKKLEDSLDQSVHPSVCVP